MTAFYALFFVGGFAVTLGVLFALCRVAARLGLVDHPTGRKAHLAPTPVVGGIAIAVGATLTMSAALILSSHATALLHVPLRHVGFVCGVAILALMGIWDDWRPIPARYKLLIQMFCCVLAVFVDKNVVGDLGMIVFGHAMNLGPLVAPFSVLVLLTVTNAMNMIDGIDGLAGGINFVAFAIMAKALTTAGFPAAPYVVAVLGALAAFLALNFPLFPKQRAQVFLGDSGSLLFGFALGYLAISLAAIPGRVFQPSTAMWLFFIPVADTVLLYLRRMLIARAPFAAGRDHIHHLLMQKFSARTTAWILVGASALLSGGAYFAERKGVPNLTMFLSWIGLFGIYAVATQKPWREAWNRSRAIEAQPAVETEAQAGPSIETKIGEPAA